MIQALTRFTFVTGGLLGGYAATSLVDWQNELGVPRSYVIFLLIILGGAIGYVLGGIIGTVGPCRLRPSAGGGPFAFAEHRRVAVEHYALAPCVPVRGRQNPEPAKN